MHGRLSQLLQRHFPPVAHAFAYGSGVMHQPGLYADAHGGSSSSSGSGTGASTSGASGTRSGPMVDLIFAVDDVRQWHAANIELNGGHYSWIARSPRYGPDIVTGIAEHFGVGVHFNTLVNVDGTLLKYGVLESPRLLEDLSTWRELYVAGRLHKPVLQLDTGGADTGGPAGPTGGAGAAAPGGGVSTSGVARTRAGAAQFAAAQAANVRSALTAALLQLPPRFTTESLLPPVTCRVRTAPSRPVG
jgi:hypothetical protein